MRTQHFWIRTSLSSTAAARRHAASTAAARYDRREVAGMANFKMYLLRQFCFNPVEFFYNTQETQMQKMMDQNFEIRILWFLRIFLKFSKRHRAVPLPPIWTIMATAKLDQSRVLVTKFHQNRLTLKGRSASQRPTDRQTDRQTNSAENNGPLGLQSGQQTRVTTIHFASSRTHAKRKITPPSILFFRM